ncbi:hypothetical protein H2O73_05175 [Vibrio sp. 404]|uniref:Uncharacterized protein n=1 Tax=Vibrio marinisediminis TaxID=2758441 RepID=A0A7W2FPG8_9VIBR|nr:hypothetical protein [Vibrio marinisediminis]
MAADSGYNLYLPISINSVAKQKLTFTSNDTIHIIALFNKDKYVSDEQRKKAQQIIERKIQRAAKIMQHYLTNLPQSTYGSDKSSIAQLMASRQATLMLTANDAENDQMLTKLFVAEADRQGKLQYWVEASTQANSNELDASSSANFITSSTAFKTKYPNQYQNIVDEVLQGVLKSSETQNWLLHSQSLMFRELTVEGDCHYMSNFANYCEDLGEHADRDAAFEEILHLTQAQGIAPNPIYKTFQERIQQRAFALYKRHESGKFAVWQPETSSWNDWLTDDVDPEIGPSYSHEYLAAAFEAYMGMWEHRSDGLDSYQALTRQQMQNDDSDALSWIENMFHGFLQYTADIDSNGVKKYYDNQSTLVGTPTFSMSKIDNSPAEDYTFKSRWLLNVQIVGDETINLIANDQNNKIQGNKKNNKVDGKGGIDTYIVLDEFSHCSIVHQKYDVLVNCPTTGVDELINFENIQFQDRLVSIVN